MLIRIALLLIIAVALFGQSTGCESSPWPGAPKVALYLRQPDNSFALICAEVGKGLRMLGVARKFLAAPSMKSFSVSIDPGIPDTQTQLTLTLPLTPAPNTLILASFKSSRLGGDVSDTLTPAAVNPNQVTVTLPTYRPFTAEDRLQLIYWAFE